MHDPVRGPAPRRRILRWPLSLGVISLTAGSALAKTPDIDEASDCAQLGYADVDSAERRQVNDALTASLADQGWTCKSNKKEDLQCERNAQTSVEAVASDLWRAQFICKGHTEYHYKAFYTITNVNTKIRLYGALVFNLRSPETEAPGAAESAAAN